MIPEHNVEPPMSGTDRDQPPGLYYLEHFESALRWLHDRYADLLSNEEHAFIRDFGCLPLLSQALLVRLIMRKGRLFRARKIHYPEIGPIDAAVRPLIDRHWVDPCPPLSIDEFAALVTRTELAALFTEFPRNACKADAVALLRETYVGRKDYAAWRRRDDEAAYLVRVATLCLQLRLLYFGNFRQEWSEFVLADLGIFRYEAVAFCKESRAFQCRQDIEDFFQLHACRQSLQDDDPPDDVLKLLPRRGLNHAWLEARRAKLLFQIAARYERSGERERALALYAESCHPGARLRAIRVLELEARHDDAYARACCALEAPHSPAEAQRLQRIVRRLVKPLGLPATTRKTRHAAPRVDLIIPALRAGETVERAAAAHLAAPAAPVYYVENALINSLFGLLCWEAIFAPVSGAFFHAFHTAPMDLHSVGFRAARAAHFERCWGALDSGAHHDIIMAAFRAKNGIQSPFVAWRLLTEELLSSALACIPAAHLRLFFERLLGNIAENRSGFPDLVQFWVEERRYRLIEVKGPGDRLQDNQLRLIEFFQLHRLPVTVCHVRWAQNPSSPAR